MTDIADMQPASLKKTSVLQTLVGWFRMERSNKFDRYRLRGFLDRRRLHGRQRVKRVQDHGERDAVTLAHLLDRLEFRDRAVGASPEVKVGEDCSRTRVESKCFADGQALMKRWTVCTDGDHPLLPSCAARFSLGLAAAAG